jgi:NitT/TauT family transport system ATP-binding protein
MLLDLWEKSRKTIVFVTHSIPEAVYLSDRVYVMTPRPGRNSKVYDIPLGRPRPLELTTERAFFDIVGEIKQQIYSDVDEAAKQGAYEIDRFSRVSGS